MERLMTAREVAEIVRLPISTLYQQRYMGRGVGDLAIKVGRHLRWRSSDLERWLTEQARRHEEGRRIE